MIFKDVHEMRRWAVEKVGTGWSPGAKGTDAAEIIDRMPHRPPYQTDWTEFLSTLPDDLEILVEQKRLEAISKKDFIAVVQLDDKSTRVLGVISERQKSDCFKTVYRLFPDLVTSQSKVVIKTMSQLKGSEKKQLDISLRLS